MSAHNLWLSHPDILVGQSLCLLDTHPPPLHTLVIAKTLMACRIAYLPHLLHTQKTLKIGTSAHHPLSRSPAAIRRRCWPRLLAKSSPSTPPVYSRSARCCSGRRCCRSCSCCCCCSTSCCCYNNKTKQNIAAQQIKPLPAIFSLFRLLGRVEHEERLRPIL